MADPDPTSWNAWWAALFGPLGGGAAIIKQVRSQAKTEQRMSAVEADVAALKAKDDKHDLQFTRIEKTLSTLEERSRNAEDDRQEMLQILRERL